MTRERTKSECFLGKQVEVIIDRPLGSVHPQYPKHRYDVNYGYVAGTLSGDGEELDVYVLGVPVPVEQFRGRCVGLIRRLDENDDKLVVVAEGEDPSDNEILEAVAFQEQYFRGRLIRSF